MVVNLFQKFKSKSAAMSFEYKLKKNKTERKKIPKNVKKKLKTFFIILYQNFDMKLL